MTNEKIVLQIADRLQDVDLVIKTDENLDKVEFGALGIATGVSGVALFFLYMDRYYPGIGYDLIAHKYLLHGVQLLEKDLPNIQLGLASGIVGLAFTVEIASNNGSRYQKIQKELSRIILPMIESHLGYIQKNYKSTRVSHYDTIQGAVGHLAFLSSCSETRIGNSLEKNVANYLIRKTKSGIETSEGYFVSAENQPSPRHMQQHPEGSVDLGHAHGISGVLAILSIVLKKYPDWTDCRAAVKLLADWLVAKAIRKSTKFTWPTYSDSKTASRAAWCYGAPGISASLRLASQSLEDSKYQDFGLRSLQYISSIPLENQGITTATFCHGAASVLRIVDLYQDSSLNHLKKQLENLIVKQIDESSPFYFKDLEIEKDSKVEMKSRAGILNGATGVALSLLRQCDSGEVGWERAFLIN